MSPDEYWHGSPELVKAYREAFKIRKEERNWEMWLQGWYIYQALLAALSHLDKKSKQEYLKEPIELFPPTEKGLEERRQEEAELLEQKLNTFMRRFNGNK